MSNFNTGITTDLSVGRLGKPNGFASLTAAGKIPASQLPGGVVSGLTFVGLWDASTNTPNLTSITPTNGDLYIVSVEGSQDLNGEGNELYTLKDSVFWSESEGVWYHQQDSTAAEEVIYDNTNSGLTASNLQLAIDELQDIKLDKAESRTKLTQDTTYFVDVVNGNDNNTGLSNLTDSFKTIQKAFNVIQNDIDANGYKLTVQLQDGDYTQEGVLHLPTIVSPAPITCSVSIQTSIDLQLKIVGNSNTLVRGFEIDQSGYNYAISNVKLVGDGNIGIRLVRNAYASLNELSFEGNFNKGVSIDEMSTALFRNAWQVDGSFSIFVSIEKSSTVYGESFYPIFASTYNSSISFFVIGSVFLSLGVYFEYPTNGASLGNFLVSNSFVDFEATNDALGNLIIILSSYGSFKGEPLNKYLYSTYTTPINYSPSDSNNVSSHLEAIDTTIGNIPFSTFNLPAYDDDMAAGAAGLTTGQLYQTTGAAASPLNVAGIVMVKQFSLLA